MFGTNYNMNSNVFRTAAQVNSAMLNVYNYMALAVVTSMLTSLWVASSPTLLAIFFGPITKWITIFAPLVFVFIVPIAVMSGIGRTASLALLLLFSAVMGLSISALISLFTSASIFTAFMGAAILFLTMSFYGYFTKRSLEGLGKFLFVALIAIIISSVVNIFIGSSLVQTVLSALAVLVFSLLTAYDTQQLRENLSTQGDDYSVEILGALSLYLNFINIFTSLLQLFGISKDE